ncbi:hypothetical protein JQ585_13515 [Bradyrhizobium sp. U87765 SZCCT0109]|nr:hypothetical protein [Bradyrhizobium sp. U87765 SZCCT0109]MBR1304297.1 hypothetical protein [Bradyrhizobium sp. U87765 SZCCT0110]MBR1319902.1 hypothetical protein [Bradyrhizobium sp. U87765 SZCCT0109]MBR1348228.1 hypothetical protein [Bradyrhizobium sp. U87765 SZCCT0048]
MSGNVYVFNVYSQQLTLGLNGITVGAGTIPDWLSGTGNLRYRPNGVAVPRCLNPSDSPGKFFNGRNSLTMTWLDGLFVASVAIDGSSVPLNQDLLLFINRSAWDLVNQFGVRVSAGTVLALGELQTLLSAAQR